MTNQLLLETQTKSLQLLSRDLSTCQGCSLREDLRNENLVVPGFGVYEPEIMIIGEAPGYRETVERKPFVGPSGRILQQVVTELGLSPRTNLYITNTVKHRPPNNRDPSDGEISACARRFLFKEIDILLPKKIITVGKIPTKTMMVAAGLTPPATGLRGKQFLYKNIPVFTTWHPAYVMRNPTKMEDLKTDILNALNWNKNGV